MDNPDIDYMQPTNESELKDQLEDILSGIISTLDIYDVIDNGSTYDIINLKNSNMLYEDINLKIVANIIASAISLGSRRVKPDINFLALFLSVNAALPKFVLVLPGHISETFTLEPLSSILKL